MDKKPELTDLNVPQPGTTDFDGINFEKNEKFTLNEHNIDKIKKLEGEITRLKESVEVEKDLKKLRIKVVCFARWMIALIFVLCIGALVILICIGNTELWVHVVLITAPIAFTGLILTFLVRGVFSDRHSRFGKSETLPITDILKLINKVVTK